MPEFPHPAPVTAEIRLSSGVVELIAEDRETVRVDVSPYDDRAASREAAEATQVELTGDTLTVISPDARAWKINRRTPRLRIAVRVPAGSAGWVKLASADLLCRGEWAQIDLTTASGDVDVAEVAGDLTVSTASGDLRAGHVGGRLVAHSASGNISARHVNGPSDLRTASGDMRIEATTGDLAAKTASGDLRVEAASQGTLQAASASGDVWVGVVAGTGVWLDLTSITGRTRSDLDMPGRDAAAAGDAAAASHAMSIQARTVSGDITVQRVSQPARQAPD